MRLFETRPWYKSAVHIFCEEQIVFLVHFLSHYSFSLSNFNCSYIWNVLVITFATTKLLSLIVRVPEF